MHCILQDSTELDQVLDDLLQRGQTVDPENEVVGEISCIMETGRSSCLLSYLPFLCKVP